MQRPKCSSSGIRSTRPVSTALELGLLDILRKKGITARTGVLIRHRRLDLMIEQNGVRLDIERDGAEFHTDYDRDASRDHIPEPEGWTVMRFIRRTLSRDLGTCVNMIVDPLAPKGSRRARSRSVPDLTFNMPTRSTPAHESTPVVSTRRPRTPLPSTRPATPPSLIRFQRPGLRDRPAPPRHLATARSLMP